MYKLFLPAAVAGMLIATGCGNKSGDQAKSFPKPGTIVATAQMPIKDELNNFTFSVKVVADSEVTKGVYDVDVDFGPNFAEGKFTMPRGGEDLKPLLRTGKEQYTYVVGFKVPNDTTFYEYFEISSSKGSTKMQYIKAYTF